MFTPVAPAFPPNAFKGFIMKLHALAAAAAFAFACAGPALAAERVVANLEAPVAAKIKVVAGGAVWNCEGTSCFAAAPTSRTVSVRACQALAKEVGRVAGYGGRNTLDTEDLTRCNASAPQLAETQQAAK
jgi:hypothetical protein